MNFLTWLFGTADRLPKVQGHVWMRESSLWAHLRRELEEELEAGRHVILVAHFPKRWEQLLDWLNGQTLSFNDWQPRNLQEMRRQLRDSSPCIWLIAAPEIPDIEHGAGEPSAESLPVTVMATEHHPHADGDRPLALLARALNAGGGVVVQSAFDQPLLAPHCVQLIEITKLLGMQEDEWIENDMVMRQIANLQRRNAQNGRACGPADSSADWMARYASGV